MYLGVLGEYGKILVSRYVRIYFPRILLKRFNTLCVFGDDFVYRKQLEMPVLWNRNYFLRFRFRLLKSYGSCSDF
jgi:hypothetical protein